MLRRIESRLRASSTHVECQQLQPRASSRAESSSCLPFTETRDLRYEAALAKAAEARESCMRTTAAANGYDVFAERFAPQGRGVQHLTREEKVRQYQDLLSGDVLKISADGSVQYPHADQRPGGGTQISGMATLCPSMTDNWNDPAFFKNMATTLGAGAPAIRGAFPPHLAFRLA